jgi:multimeric flavodoxin WrbA
MKQVLIIEASPRKGYSTMIASDIASILEKEVNIELVTLRDCNILPCKGCCVCLSKGSKFCPQEDDDTKLILSKMEKADGVIVITPNHSLQVTGILKNLFDRLAFVFHRPRLFGKTILPIVVQGVYGGGKVGKYINEVFDFWGMKKVKGIVVSGGVYVNKAQSEEVIRKNKLTLEKGIDRFLIRLYDERPKKPSLFHMMIFRATRSSMKYFEEALEPDKKYYENKGWITSDYYYPVHVGLFKRLIGAFIDLMIKKMAKKV